MTTDIQLIGANELRLVASGSGIPGRFGVLYQLRRSPGTMYSWDGEKMVPMVTLAQATRIGGSMTIQLWGNPDGTTRTGTFVVPAMMTVLRTQLMVGAGGNSGAGGPLAAANLTGGGAASSAEVLEFAEFPVTPGETIWFQIAGSGTGVATELRHGSSTGTLLSMTTGRGQVTASVLSGLNGGDGDGITSGAGAAGVGEGLYGRTPGAAAAARVAENAGSSGANLGGTFSANKFVTPMPAKMGGLSGGGGGFTSSSTARNGGLGPNHGTVVDGTVGLEGLSGQAGGGTGDTTHAGGSGGPGPISTTLKNGASNGGGAGAYAGNDSHVPGGAGSGGATGFPGGLGCVGHISISNWPGNALASAPPAIVVYSGAGIAVPPEIVGLHISADAGRLNSVTGAQAGGKALLTVDRPVTNNRYGLIFRSGTPPVSADTGLPLELGKLYYINPFGPAPSSGSHNTVGVARTEDGASLNLTTAGAAAVAEVIELEPLGAIDYGLLRTLSLTNLHWAGLHTADQTFSATGLAQLQRLATALRASGRRMVYSLMSTPSWASTSSGGSLNPYGYANGAYPAIRTAGGDGKMPIRQFVAWLVANVGDVIAAIELGNEPAFPGSGTGYYAGTAADLVHMYVDAKAELVAMGSSILLIGPAASGGSSAADSIRVTAGTLYSFLTAAATASGTLGKDAIDGISLYPYDHTAVPFGPENLPMWRSNMALIVSRVRRALQMAGLASYATFPVWMSEVGFSGSVIETNWPQLDVSTAFLGSFLCAAATGAKHLNAYAFGSADSRYMSRNLITQGVLGDVKRHIAGKTLTYAALLNDSTWTTTTQEEGASTWSPRWAPA